MVAHRYSSSAHRADAQFTRFTSTNAQILTPEKTKCVQLAPLVQFAPILGVFPLLDACVGWVCWRRELRPLSVRYLYTPVYSTCVSTWVCWRRELRPLSLRDMYTPAYSRRVSTSGRLCCHVFICTYMYIYAYICLRMYMYVCMYVCIYTYMIYGCVYVCMYVCMYVCVYRFINPKPKLPINPKP
jgi:hypothetical protein